MTRPRLVIGFALCAALSIGKGFSAEDKNADVKPFNPAKFEGVYHLPFFCVEQGLKANRKIAPVDDQRESAIDYVPGVKCGEKSIYVPPGNADDVATALTPKLDSASASNATVTAAAAVTGTATATATGAANSSLTQFTLSATSDKLSEIIFCRDRCGSGLTVLTGSIRKLAQPKFAYYKDYPVDSQDTGDALAKAVPAINDSLTAEAVDSATLRVESSRPLSDAEIKDFEKRLTADQVAFLATQKAPAKDAEAEQAKKELSGAPAATEVVHISLPDFCQANDLKTTPTIYNKDEGCKEKFRQVTAGNVDAVITALTAALGTSSKLKIAKDGGRILISCDGKCAGPAKKLAQDTINAIARPVPLFATDVEVPRGTSLIAAAAFSVPPLSAVPLTDTLVRVTSETPIPDNDLDAALERVRQHGFGPPEFSPLQRMFYRSAAGVVADLLATPVAPAAAVLGGDAATAPVTGNAPPPAAAAASASPAGATGSPAITISVAPAAASTSAAAPTSAAAAPAPTGDVGQGMTAVDDLVVFTDTKSASAVNQRRRLLALLDLPRPEVLMNMWSFQASSPDGRDIAVTLQRARNLVNANNDALQNALNYGWAYLSREMKDRSFFDADFYNYVTQRYVADTAACQANEPSAKDCLTSEQRRKWDACERGRYCLGYQNAFDPVRPTLSSILLGMIAAKNSRKVVLTTLGCMEGKFEVYPDECFPERKIIKEHLLAKAPPENPNPADCLTRQREAYVQGHAQYNSSDGESSDAPAIDSLAGNGRGGVLACEMLDRAAIDAQKACGMTVTLPLSCFTIQAAKSFLPDNSFSTFSLTDLNTLAEVNLADKVGHAPLLDSETYSAPSIGLLRSAVADFLFNYKMAIQYPKEFSPYYLPHSAQELNSELNPLVVAFNQDVAAFSQTLMSDIEKSSHNQDSFLELWRHNKSYIADGTITVRGISGVESLVDTDTQSAFDSTQAQTLGAVLNSITGSGSSAAAAASTNSNSVTINQDGSVVPVAASSGGAGISCSSGGGSPLCAVANLLKGGSTATGIATALAAITPVKSHTMIGRQLTLDVIPHTLPGASSAELDVRLWAQEDSAPTIYPESGASSSDFVSRVARHNVATRVRVESIKLFEISSFTAMIQRPRAKFPILPPFVEIPLIGSLLSIPLPAAKVFHSSSAIVSAIIVPTAADFAYGIQFKDDRAVLREDKRFAGLDYSLRTLTSQRQWPAGDFVYGFHNLMVRCLATNQHCNEKTFADVAPER